MPDQFERYLRDVISSTNHDENHSDEERYFNVMVALFGKSYKRHPKIPKGYTYDDMQKIALRAKRTKNLEGSIKEFLENKYPQVEKTRDDLQYELESERDDNIENGFVNIKAHFVRGKDFYAWLEEDKKIVRELYSKNSSANGSNFQRLIDKQQQRIAAYIKTKFHK